MVPLWADTQHDPPRSGKEQGKGPTRVDPVPHRLREWSNRSDIHSSVREGGRGVGGVRLAQSDGKQVISSELQGGPVVAPWGSQLIDEGKGLGQSGLIV